MNPKAAKQQGTNLSL